MGRVGGAGGGVGGSSDTGMASAVAGRTLGGNSNLSSGSNMTSLSPNDVGAAGLTGLVGGVRPGEGGVGGAAVPGTAISAGIGTGGESGTVGSLAGPGSGQGLQQMPQQGQSIEIIVTTTTTVSSVKLGLYY